MQKLTEQDLRGFLERTKTTPAPEHFRGEDIEQLFTKVLQDLNLIPGLTTLLVTCLFHGGPPHAALSLWSTGFQMGRDFEQSQREVAELNRLVGSIDTNGGGFEPPVKRKGRRSRRKEGQP